MKKSIENGLNKVELTIMEKEDKLKHMSSDIRSYERKIPAVRRHDKHTLAGREEVIRRSTISSFVKYFIWIILACLIGGLVTNVVLFEVDSNFTNTVCLIILLVLLYRYSYLLNRWF